MEALKIKYTSCTLLFVFFGVILSDESLQTTEALNQAYYTYGQDSNNYYSDYGYQLPQEASLNPFSLTQERTGGLEAFITAPLVVTAFIAALFGGFVSPLISNGLATMSQFEITLPQIRRINVTEAENATETQSRMLHYLHLLNENEDV